MRHHGAAAVGSSPRAQGTHVQNRVRSAAKRFIPACAGEHRVAAFTPRCGIGSSPRARGTRTRWAGVRGGRRFIPACAGNTSGPPPPSSPWPVHPRVRGEHRLRCGDLSISSPPRFIPACAGNSLRREHRSCQRAKSGSVHPRVRGEHSASASILVVHIGSSPRARGTPLPEVRRRRQPRFIPACAGNTKAGLLGQLAISYAGSSPRVRGEHRVAKTLLFEIHPQRFIPACAGNTNTQPASLVPRSVHPRVRGEHIARS